MGKDMDLNLSFTQIEGQLEKIARDFFDGRGK